VLLQQRRIAINRLLTQVEITVFQRARGWCSLAVAGPDIVAKLAAQEHMRLTNLSASRDGSARGCLQSRI
jgi:hypothetical protein